MCEFYLPRLPLRFILNISYGAKSVSHLDEEVDRVWKVKLLCETKSLERKTANNQWSFQKYIPTWMGRR